MNNLMHNYVIYYVYYYNPLRVEKELLNLHITYRKYYIRCCINTIRLPDDEHRVARKMYRIIIINI